MQLPRSLARYLTYLFAVSALAVPLVACQPGASGVDQAAPAPTAVLAVEQATPVEAALPTAEALPTVVAAATAEAPNALATVVTAPAPASYAELRNKIEAELKGLNGEWGIAARDLRGDDVLLMGADRPYPAASLYKLLLLYTAYQKIGDGGIELEQMTRMLESDYVESVMWDEELKIGDRVSVKGLLRVMIIQSSNAAAHALTRVMGSSSVAQTVNIAAQQLGLAQTRMPVAGDRSRFSDWRAEQTSTSVGDLARFFTLLYQGQLVSQQASKDMMALLQEQQINDRIPARLPRGVKVAHKTGNLTGVVADAGIIFGPRSDVLLIVLNDGADYEPATAAIGAIADVVYRWHNQ